MNSKYEYDYEDVALLTSYVKISSYRVKILLAFNDENDLLMPTEISQKSEIIINHVSKVLRELRIKNLIELINPEVKKGRLYRLTDLGVLVKKELTIKMNEGSDGRFIIIDNGVEHYIKDRYNEYPSIIYNEFKLMDLSQVCDILNKQETKILKS